MKQLVLLLFLYPLLTFSQDQKAQSILKELSKKTSSYQTIEAHYTNLFTSEIAKVNETKKGIIYVKGNAFKLETDDQLIISDGETNWIYLIDENEVSISEGNDDEMLNPSTIFRMYEKGYKHKYVGDDGKNYIIDLYPNESGPFTKIVMKINKSKLEINSFTMIDKHGSLFTYIIDKFIANKELSDDFFKFDSSKYPEIDIIDLR